MKRAAAVGIGIGVLVASVAIAKPYGPKPPPVALAPKVCEAPPDGGPVAGPDCVTATLHCGDTITGNTRGGVQRFDSRFYEKNFCWPRTLDHDSGDERVYAIDLKQGQAAYITMDAPCAPLSLFAIRWSGDTCPTPDSQIRQCEAEVRPGGGGGAGGNILSSSRKRIDVSAIDRDVRWLLVVEGQGDAEGPFALTVQCDGAR